MRKASLLRGLHVLELVPGRHARAERTLSLEEDRLLADHLLVSAEGVKPPIERVPVVPLALSLSIAAEVASLLAPGRRLAAAADVRASRWILPSGDGLVRLVGEASVDRAGDGPIRTTLTDGERREPSLTARFSFAPAGSASERPATPLRLAGARRSRLDSEAIYRERLFHGPGLRPLVGRPRLAENGAEAELLAPRGDLFGFDAVSLDGVEQLLGLWGSERGLDLFPIGIDLLRLHVRRPREGRRMLGRIVVTGTGGRLVEADATVRDGRAVWLELHGLRMGASPVSERASSARRRPADFLLGQRLRAPGLPADAVCVVVPAEEASGPLDVIARTWLTHGELLEMRCAGPDDLSWLAARIAAKDAARCWSVGGEGVMPHPASFSFDGRGVPVGLPGRVPFVALAAAGARHLAVAHGQPVALEVDPPESARRAGGSAFLLGGHRFVVSDGSPAPPVSRGGFEAARRRGS